MEQAKETIEEVVSLTLRQINKDIEYNIQLIEGIYTVDIKSIDWTRNYKIKSRNGLYKWVKGILKEKDSEEPIKYRLGYNEDCYIEDVKYRILEVLQDYIDLIGEIYVVK
jgi:hypothetical protein